MPIIKSAKKRVRTASKATARNSKTKRGLRAAIKAFHANITGNNANQAQSAIDKAVKKGVISKNKAARKKKQLANASKSAGVKVVASSKTASKAAVKPVAKKSVKTPTKKPAAKKTTAKK